MLPYGVSGSFLPFGGQGMGGGMGNALQGGATVGQAGQSGGQAGGQGSGLANLYSYYGEMLDGSRLKRVMGIAPPPPTHLQLQGYGLSELEFCLKEIQTFLKLEKLIFELLDEAKIDVYLVNGLANQLLDRTGTEKTRLRFQFTNAMKSYQNAVILDKEDEYQQKQLGNVFNGVSAICDQIRMNMAAAVRFPMDKLFGQSADGMNASGEDTIENYNAIVEGVRKKAEPLLKWAIRLRAKTLFGFEPEFTVKWPSLRILGAMDQETVNTSKQARALALYGLGLLKPKALEQILRKEGLLSVSLENEPLEMGEDGGTTAAGTRKPGDKGNGGEKGKKAAPAAKGGSARK
jgi:hypothetical protein